MRLKFLFRKGVKEEGVGERRRSPGKQLMKKLCGVVKRICDANNKKINILHTIYQSETPKSCICICICETLFVTTSLDMRSYKLFVYVISITIKGLYCGAIIFDNMLVRDMSG